MLVWGAILHKNVVDLFEVEGKMDSEYYCNILQDCMVNCNGRELEKDWILQHDHAVV